MSAVLWLLHELEPIHWAGSCTECSTTLSNRSTGVCTSLCTVLRRLSIIRQEFRVILSAAYLSVLRLLRWPVSFLKRGSSIREADIPPALPECQSAVLLNNIMHHWDAEVELAIANTEKMGTYTHASTLCSALTPRATLRESAALRCGLWHVSTWTGTPHRPRFFRAFVLAFKWNMTSILLLLLMKHAVQLLQTQFLSHLLMFYQTYSTANSDLTYGCV